MSVPLDRSEIGLTAIERKGRIQPNPARRFPIKKYACIGACLVVSTLIACQQSPANLAPNTREDFQFSEDWKSRQALVPVALGREPADVVVKGGQVFIAQTGELKDGWIIATKGKRIAYLGPQDETPKAAADQNMIDALVGPETKVLDASGQTLVPGFGHSHDHIESSRLTPDRFAQVALPLGTTWLVEGDHETGNVLGEAGVTFWLDMQPKHFKVFPAVTSAVPPTDDIMEPTGGWIGYESARRLFAHDPRVRSVGEVMYEPGIQDPESPGYQRLHQVLQAGWDARQAIQGHTGGNDYRNISSFRSLAVRSNHNPHGPIEGTNDHIVRVARLGLWTDNPPNRAEFGALVVEGGKLIDGVEPAQDPPPYTLDTVSLARKVTSEDFRIRAPESKTKVTAWLWRPHDFRERPDTVELPVEDGIVQYGTDLGVYKMAAIARHESLGPEPAAEIQMGAMFTATSPSHPCSAVATTVQHDAHQLTIDGSCDEAMAMAANRLVEIGGGFVVVADGKIQAEVRLPVTGLMSNAEPETLLRELATMRAASDALEWAGFDDDGHQVHATDAMTFWFLTPAPWLWNLTTRGLFDLITGEKLPVVW